MAKGRFVSYLRVSTARQGASGLGLEAQREAVTRYLDGGRWTLVAEHVEVESGKVNARPELAKALADCRVHKATLVVSRLDRLARNAHFLLGLQDAGVDFVACDMPFATKLTVGILACVAEAEGEMISARTKAALAAAKARGVKLGSPRPMTAECRAKGREAALAVRRASRARWLGDVGPLVSEAVTKAGTLAGAAARLNAKGIPARRGGRWTAAQVSQVARVGASARPS